MKTLILVLLISQIYGSMKFNVQHHKQSDIIMLNRLKRNHAKIFNQDEYIQIAEANNKYETQFYSRNKNLSSVKVNDLKKGSLNLLQDVQKVLTADSPEENQEPEEAMEIVADTPQEDNKVEEVLEKQAPIIESKVEEALKKIPTVENKPQEEEHHKEYLTDHQNNFFTGKMQVGSNKQEFNMIFDTGSGLMFVNSLQCDSSLCKFGNQFDSDKSDTFKIFNPTIQDGEEYANLVEVEYGSGSLEGILAVDDITIAGLTVKQVGFIEISKMEGQVFASGQFDGIVGLSFPDPSDGVLTLMDDFFNQNVISQNIFSFYLDRENEESKSFFQIGGYDPTFFKGELHWHPVKNKRTHFWNLSVTEIYIGNQNTKICMPNYPCNMVLDSGTSFFTGPTKDIQKLFEILEYETKGCQNITDLDDISFVINGQHYTIEPKDYILSVTRNGYAIYHHSRGAEIEECVGTFHSLDVEPPLGPLWVLGDIFLSKFYSVYDRKNYKIGLAPSI